MKKLLLFIILLFSCSGFSQDKEKTYDYIILKDALKSFAMNADGKRMYLTPDATNSYTISVVESQLKRFLGTLKPEDLYHDLGRDSIFDKIFNDKEFDHLLSQESNLKWDFNQLNIDNLFPYDNKLKTKDLHSVIVGKPIYTRNQNYALVEVGTRTWRLIMVYRKENDKCIVYKGIEPISIQPKIELYRE